MRYLTLCLIIVASLGAACAVAEEALPADTRLDRKITYAGGYKRLHVIAEDLSRMSGVEVACGRNAADWHIRDIPMIVCVNEMPLGQLLHTIADAAHLDLKVAQEDGDTTYRLWRGGEHGAELDSHLTAVRKALTAQHTWDWETLSRLSKVTEETLKQDSGKDDNLVSYARHLSRILTSFGHSTKTRILDGKVVRVTLADVPRGYRDDLEALFLDAYLRDGEIGGVPRPEVREERLAQCGLVMLREEGVAGDIRIRPRLDKWGRSTPIEDRLSDLASALVTDKTRAAIKMPARPRMPDVPEPTFEHKSLSRVDFGNQFLKTKVRLTRPAKDGLSVADAWSALSEATGINIICEDFLSHRAGQPNVDDLFKDEIAVGDVLKRFSARLDWYMSEEDRLIVGCVADWPTQHRDLAPEELISYLQARSNGDGVDLDEYLLYAFMDPDQRTQWAVDSRELSRISPGMIPHLTYIWRFYASLTPEQKAQARSESGLRLDYMGTRAVSDLLWKDWDSLRLYTWLHPDRLLDPEPSVDPSARFILKVTSANEYPPFSMIMPDDEQQMAQLSERARRYAELPTHHYAAEVNAEIGGEVRNLLRRIGPQRLPMYSEKREAELRKAAHR